MKLYWVFFALCIGLCSVVLLAFLIEEVPNRTVEATTERGAISEKVYEGHGITHPVFPSMLYGGDGAERHRNIVWLGLAFGLIQIAFFAACLFAGMRKHGATGPLAGPILLGAAGFALIFVFLVLSYRGYLTDEERSLFLSLPLPTAWMFYGIWIFPVYFIALYMWTFDKWTVTEDDLRRFDAMLAERRAREPERT